MPSIDLNADVGEGVGNDAVLLDVVSSANVACGFHAGSSAEMREICATAAGRGVVVGAQVSYDDREGFGRRFRDVDPHRLRDDVLYQLGALAVFCRRAGTRVRYVKPHGALYAACSSHPAQGDAVVDAMLDVDPDLALLCGAGTGFAARAAARGLRVVAEGFADRGYAADGSLVPRGSPGDLLADPAACAAQALALARGEVGAVDGSRVSLRVESICVHGDSTGAVANAVAVRQALVGGGFEVKAALCD